MAWIGKLTRSPEQLRQLSAQLDKLTSMPDRVHPTDIRNAAQAILDCSNDIQALLKGELVGCPCRRIEHDDYAYIDYADECRHHHSLKARLNANDAHVREVEKKLKETARTRFAERVLVALADYEKDPWVIAKRAFLLADAMVAALLQ